MGLVYVFVGGGIGSLIRYFVSSGVTRIASAGFPWGILVVNITGGFVMGMLVEFFALKWSVSQEVRMLVITGLMGGYTTFSAFSLDAATMIERGDWAPAGAYIAASVIGSIFALFAAMALVRNVVA